MTNFFSRILLNEGEFTLINFNLIFILSALVLAYFLFILYLTYLILKKKINLKQINYISIVKDWEFIQFKNNLFNLYYTLITILFIYLFRNTGFNWLFEGLTSNIFFIFILILTILLNNSFILFLFKFYKEFKALMHSLSDSNIFINNNKGLFPTPSSFCYLRSYTQVRNFSTSLNKNNNNSSNLNYDSELNSDPAIENLNNDQIIELFQNDPEFHKKYQALHKSKAVNAFKKVYGGGILGYSDIKFFGNVSQFIELAGLEYLQFIDNLENKLNEYLNEIPENVVFSLLPVLRWQYINGEHNSLSISESIKITRDTDRILLAKRILLNISETLRIYELQGLDIELIMMGRPWLSADDFDIEKSGLTDIFDEQIEREIAARSSSTIKKFKQNYEGTSLLKIYEYKNVYMDNYGDPIYDKNNNLIGYKIDNNSYASVFTYYNNENLLCDKVSIRSLSEINLPYQDSIIDNQQTSDPLIHWVETKTEGGFIREFYKNKYYYDKNNNLINRETGYTCSLFPIYIKDSKFNEKFGTIDF